MRSRIRAGLALATVGCMAAACTASATWTFAPPPAPASTPVAATPAAPTSSPTGAPSSPVTPPTAASSLTPAGTARTDVALVPTGVDALTPETGWYARVVADGTGILWAREDDGRLVRFDPATGSGRSWTVADDAAFSATSIAPARDGGVWLAGGRELRWFDGRTFRRVIEAPAELGTAAEAPDGSLWAGTTDGRVLHWDGSSWTDVGLGRSSPDAVVNALTVDEAGHPWVGWLQYPTPPGTGSVATYDGAAWTTFDAADAAPLGGAVWSIAQVADGQVWVASATGLARFDGTSWSVVTAAVGAPQATSVAAASDGGIWTAGGDTDDGEVTVGRFDGHSWASWGPAAGLPGPLESGFYTAWAVPIEDRVYVGTGAGIFALSGGVWMGARPAWERVWPATFAPMAPGKLLAVSRDELWATGEKGLWHFANGAWARESIDPRDPEGRVEDLALAPDGTVWATGDAGIAYRRDGRWVVADSYRASMLAFGADGAVWGAGGEGGVWELRREGSAWVRRQTAVIPLSWGVGSLGIDTSGAPWIGAGLGFMPGALARFDGKSWETIKEIAGAEISGAQVVGTAADGRMWVLAQVPREDGKPGYQSLAATFDGTTWTVVDPPAGFADYELSLAPDGSVRASAWWESPSLEPVQMLARYAGGRWTLPCAATSVPSMRLAAVAPDGTVFGSIASSFFRLPAPSPSP